MAAKLQCYADSTVGCTFSTSGVCGEDVRPASKCPHLREVAETPSTPRAKKPARAKATAKPKLEILDAIPLPSGDDLSLAQASELRRIEGATVVALAGEQGVGKTTLIASLYDRFLEGTWEKLRFAGSETLVGFERRLHLARRASGAVKADMEHTSRQLPVHFLHLRLSQVDSAERRSLLLGDLYGERFRDAADSQDVCRNELKHVRYADHLALCLDGGKLIDFKERQRAVSFGASLLHNLLDVGYLDRSSIVDLIITKWDDIVADKKVAVHQRFIAQIETNLQSEIGPRVASLRSYHIAARPEAQSQLDSWYGLDALLANWLSPKPAIEMPPLKFDAPANLRESERYLARRLPEFVTRREGR